MRNWILFSLAFSVCLPGPWGGPEPAKAADARSMGLVAASETIPPYLATYASSAELRPDFSSEPPKAALEPISSPSGLPNLQAAASPAAGSRSGWRRYLPVFYSLLLPGAGEISMGAYKRGAALVAAEATAWTGWAINHNRGLDSRAEFEAFADKNWNHDRWIVEHVGTAMLGGDPNLVTFARLDSFGQSAGYQGVFPGYHPYAPKQTERLNYYENIGKYDWFISGWADWNRAAPGNAQQVNTPLRDQYRSIRNRSNDQLDRADRFVFLSVAARVFSLVETLLMVRNRGNDPAPSAFVPVKSYSLTARSTGLASGEIAFEYRFR